MNKRISLLGVAVITCAITLTVLNFKVFASTRDLESSLVVKAETEQVETVETISSKIKTVTIKTDKVIYSGVNYNPQDVREFSNVSKNDLAEVLSGTGLEELAPYYVEAEELYGVNALFLLSISAQESAWGQSDRALNDNNYTGFGVYEDDSEGINSDTKRGNILTTAKCLKELYLTVGGDYYSGYSSKAVNIRYCLDKNKNTDFKWHVNIDSIANGLKADILEARKTYKSKNNI